VVSREEEWLWGWDDTPGIVSVWAETDGRASVWRRIPDTGELVCEEDRFRPWFVLASLEDLAHLGKRLRQEQSGPTPGFVTYEELTGPGQLRYLVRADDARALANAILRGASRRMRRSFTHLRELGKASVLALSPEEQYLVASGRTYFRDLRFDDLRRAQFDLETTGLDPERDRIFLVAVRDADGHAETLTADGTDDDAEASLVRRLMTRIREIDPDVVENHNLHGFDLPFLVRRAQLLRVPFDMGRAGGTTFRRRPSARSHPSMPRVRYTIPGRELVDSLDAVIRYDFSARDLPGRGLKAVARHFGLARAEREQIAGARVFEVFARDPDRVRVR